MELIYSMRRKPLKCEPPHFESLQDTEVTRPICTISSSNIIAFSSPTELSDYDGETWSGHVYVCDLDTPWESHKVTSSAHPVSALEWDTEGKQLLVATTIGDVFIYSQKDYLLNEWSCVYSTSFPGENIIKAIFFHNGRRVVLTDKKPDSPIPEKIQVLRSTPTLKGFGGIASNGACIVTASGVFGAIVEGATVTESLRSHRDHLTTAAMAASHTGKVVVAAVSESRVRCASITLHRPPRPPLLQPLAAVCIGDDVGVPSSLSWCLRDDTDSLLIAGKTITLWKLAERAYPVHKLLSKGPVQGNTTPGGGPKPDSECFTLFDWQQIASWPLEKATSAVATSTCRMSASASGVVASPLMLHLLPSREKGPVITGPVVTHEPGAEITSAGSTPPKKPKYGHGTLPPGSPCAVVTSVDISWLGGVVIAIDSHAQLHVYKIPQPWADIPTPLSVQHASTLLEYSMVSGIDCHDVLMSLKTPTVEALYERITETFQRQPQAFQQYYYHSWLTLRIALCRIVSSLQSSASALTSFQSLHAVWGGCVTALRLDDRADVAVLAALIDDQSHADTEKTLLALESKTELPCDAQQLQAVRCQLQRAVDTAATVLASLPAQGQGYEPCGDPAFITLLRKLVVLVRASGRSGDALQRPLARLAACKTPSHDLIEECATISAQMGAPRVWESLPHCSVGSPHGRPWPLYFEYDVEPEALRYSPEVPTQCDTTPSLAMDSIRYMYLGGGRSVARWRQCGRCGTRALPAAQPARHPLPRALDARFLPTCRCGGKWTLCSNV